MQVQGCKIRVQTLVQRFTGLFARQAASYTRRQSARPHSAPCAAWASTGTRNDASASGDINHSSCVCLPALRVQPCTAQVKRAQQQELPVPLQCLPESFKSCVRRIAAELCQPKGREFRRQQNAVLAARKRSIS